MRREGTSQWRNLVDESQLFITIDTMDSPTEHADAVARTLLAAALLERLANTDLDHAMQIYPSPEALAARMLDTLPDTLVTDPLVGPAYSAPALARWKQLTRQAVDQQRRAGRLFAVMVDRRWLYPAVQFDNYGRQSASFRAVLEQHRNEDPVEVAIWLETPDQESGIAPKAAIRRAEGDRTAAERFFDSFVPTIIQPPAMPAESGPDE